MQDIVRNNQRISQARKDANDKQWYKDQADLLQGTAFSENNFIGFGEVSEYKRKKVNYDLFNNIINVDDFAYVCKPYGASAGELPANLTNRDIVSGKLKVLLGMEMKMPFSWKVVAVNEEATSRKEEEEFRMIREFVTNEVMRPIKLQIEKEARQNAAGRELSPDEEAQIAQQIQQETTARTPDEARKYMARDHQDPAEIMGHQLLEYVVQKEKCRDKFNKGWKHTLLSGLEVYHLSLVNGEPCHRVVNPLYFDYDMSPDLDFIEDGEWAAQEIRMSPSEVVATFGSELTDYQIDQIYSYNQTNPHSIRDADFTFQTDRSHEAYTVRVMHFAWKSLKKIGFLDYIDKNGKKQKMLVDETYRVNEDQGDLSIKWEWIPEAHEVYKILDDIYVYARPVPGQHKDLDNLYKCKLPYYGAACDNLNSIITSPMDRIKSYQYFYNVLIYRVELLMASDKGKILAANINAIPKSAGIDITKFQYFMEANKIAWFNPQEEGNRGSGDVTNLVKEIDMSLASQIDKYIALAEYIERKCGESIGVTKAMEGGISANEAVSNTRQNIVQSSHIIQPYFELHNIVKGNVLTGLLELSKIAYSGGNSKRLTYVLDDMSLRMLNIDAGMLDSTTYGFFLSNSSKAHDAKQAVEQLAQAALQNQQANLSDIIKIIRSESVTEAEELLEVAEAKATDNMQRIEEQKAKANEAQMAAEREVRREEMAHDERMIVVKERERRETEIQKQTILSLGFNEDKDLDADGTPDVLEVAKFGVDADVKQRKQILDEQKFQHQKGVDKEKLKLEGEKLNAQKNKPRAT